MVKYRREPKQFEPLISGMIKGKCCEWQIKSRKKTEKRETFTRAPRVREEGMILCK